MTKKKILALLLAAVMVVGLFATFSADEPSFSDVPASHWAFDEIEKAVDSGIVNGYADGTFKPTGTVTNAHFAAMIAREYYVNALEQLGALPEGQANWWYGGIAACNSSDILDGTKVGNEHESTGDWGSTVNAAMNRYDMAQAMYNLLKAQGATMPSEADQTEAQAKIGDWSSIPANYQDAVAVCYALGLLNGQSDGTFGGQNNMNRAQACVVIDRLNQYIEDGSVVTDPGADDTTPPADTDVEEPEEQETETPATSGTLANGKPVTEENVLKILEEIKAEYPQDSPWGEDDRHSSPVFGSGRECAGYAYMVSDRIFGVAPYRIHKNYEEIRPGDVIEMKNSNGVTYHWEVATTTVDSEGNFGITSGNNGGLVGWGWSSVNTCEQNGFIVYTRYPD